MRFLANTFAGRGGYTAEERSVTSRADAEAALREIASWPGYAVSPLVDKPQLAAQFGVGSVRVKDESARFGVGSFKALGGAYAAALKLREVGDRSNVTLCCATDGNHGQSVAFAAQRAGCGAVIYMHEHALLHKEHALQRLGARVIRVPGTYDDSVRIAQEESARCGWLLISDTAASADPTTCWVMQGYGVIALELLEQLRTDMPTHVVFQAGVGGLAAGIAGVFADVLGDRRPHFIVVEPENAACLLESALRMRPSRVAGELNTEMHMLAAGEASTAAWPVVQRRIDTFIAIDDDPAVKLARELRSTATAVAGLAGMKAICTESSLAQKLSLNRDAKILAFLTEAPPS